MGIFLFANIFGNAMAMQVIKLSVFFYFSIKFIYPQLKNRPATKRVISFIMAYSSILFLLSIYYMNTKTNYGLSLIHIRILDTLLMTLLSVQAISFFRENLRLKGMSSFTSFFAHLYTYKVPINIFLSVGLLLFFHITYDILTAQLASLVSVISLIPMVMGLDLFEQFENIQDSTLDIHNK